jgi:hypothetical protein
LLLLLLLLLLPLLQVLYSTNKGVAFNKVETARLAHAVAAAAAAGAVQH